MKNKLIHTRFTSIENHKCNATHWILTSENLNICKHSKTKWTQYLKLIFKWFEYSTFIFFFEYNIYLCWITRWADCTYGLFCSICNSTCFASKAKSGVMDEPHTIDSYYTEQNWMNSTIFPLIRFWDSSIDLYRITIIEFISSCSVW